MDDTLIVVTFFISWCIALFLALPFGIVTPEAPDPLHAPGAPVRAGIRRKACWAMVIAALVTALIVYLYKQPWATFR